MLRTRKLNVYIRILLLVFAWGSLATTAHAHTTLANAFPGAFIEPELRPMMEEFLNLSLKAGIQLPLPTRIKRITIVSHEQLLNSITVRGDIRAVTIMEPYSRETTILLDSALRTQPQELRILLFHELLHAAGYDHPNFECHWAETGCGIMGRSPFPHLKIGLDHANEMIRKSFTAKYLANLPLIFDSDL
ncbi:MAG TPA: hypothetical protein VE954_14325 [Oligoflexus sp.]|uniref:hypothetical protein n=1 Tax=Oligoflexus sp. TaxID=1971216 RepID=UPI002D44F248|nr:hypothetical protein [Oligoflexus sp.]HYX34275.1 hypothetical protein [Oligoflexus sp.]